MKTITIHRKPGLYGKVRVLKIQIDGKQVATVKQKETVTIEVQDGDQELWGKMDWGKTRRIQLDTVQSGQTVTFKAHFPLNPLKGLGISTLPFSLTVD